MVEFKKEMIILKALKSHPRVKEVFLKYGMGCTICMGAVTESIEVGAKLHGVDVETIIKELNNLKANGEKKRGKR